MPVVLLMGFLNFFSAARPKLTEPMVRKEERRARDSVAQLKLMRRYAKAYGTRRVNEAETSQLWRLADSVASEQVRILNDSKPIKQATESAAIATQKMIGRYAKSLISRGGK